MSDSFFGVVDCTTCRYAHNPNLMLKSGPLQCRRHPPTVFPVQQPNGQIGAMAMWPQVGKGDGCGDGLPRMVVPLGEGAGESMPISARPVQTLGEAS